VLPEDYVRFLEIDVKQLEAENKKWKVLLKMAYDLAMRDVVNFKHIWGISASKADDKIKQALKENNAKD